MQVIQGGKPQSAVAELVQDYKYWQQAQGFSPRTWDTSERTLTKVFLPWLEAQGVSEPHELHSRLLLRFQADLVDRPSQRSARPLSRHTAATYVRQTKAFLNWLRKQDFQVGSLEQVKTPHLVKEPLSRVEIQRIEDAAPTERDKLIIRLLADTGIRASELLQLRCADLGTTPRGARYIKVGWTSPNERGGKGAREREVLLAGKLWPRLRHYIASGRPQDAQSDRVLISLRRRPGGDYEPLTLSGLDQMIRVAGQRAGIGRRVHPHLFRHSFVTWADSQGLSPMQIMKVTGHRSIQMVQHYTHHSVDDAFEALSRILAG